MSKLNELIAELCPNGVEFKPMWSLTAWDKKFNGIDRSMQKKVIPYHYYLAAEFDQIEREDGDVFYLSTGVSGKDRFTTEELAGDNVAEGEVVCIPWGGTPNVKYYKGKFVTGDNRIATSLDLAVLDNKYLYYWMQSQIDLIGSFYRGSGIKHPSMKSVLELKVPVPPLEVQREIVRVLDNFTFLSAELSAELSARKKQADYYRGKMILSASDYSEYELSDICSIIDCPHSSPKWKEEGVPVIRNYNLVNGTIDTTKLSYVSEDDYKERIKRVEPQENDILFSREAPIGNVGIIPAGFKCCQGQRVVLLRPFTQYVLPRFLIHVLQSDLVRNQIGKVEGVGATVSNFNIADLKKLKILLPPLDAQRIIADKLDVFNKYCFDITSGLPREIQLREQQYQYYRDILLSFKERTAS